MTLATSGPDGVPHAADVYFAADEELNLYFFSDPLSQHGVDIARNGSAAVTIHPDCQGWEGIRGLQLRGEVGRVESGMEWDLTWNRYVAKFPFASELREIVALNQLFVFHPHWIRLVDNRRGFGYKEEWLRTSNKLPEAPGNKWSRIQPEIDHPGEIGG